MRKCTVKQEAYSQAIVLNPKRKVESYKKAGYAWEKLNKNSLSVQADKVHNRPNVRLRIEELQKAKDIISKKEFNIDAMYVLRRLKEIDELDIIDILNDDLKSFKSLKEWPKVWRQNIEGIDIVTMTRDDEDFESVLRKIKWPNKTKNLELLGKHQSVSAFKENLNISGRLSIIDEVKITEKMSADEASKIYMATMKGE